MYTNSNSRLTHCRQVKRYVNICVSIENNKELNSEVNPGSGRLNKTTIRRITRNYADWHRLSYGVSFVLRLHRS